MARITSLLWVFLLAAGCDREKEQPSPSPIDSGSPAAHPELQPLRRWLGDEAQDETGRRLAVDDWDGDGRDEIVIGAPSSFVYGSDAVSFHGGVYRVAADTPDGVLEEVALGSLKSSRNGDYFGYYLAAAGDLTGDGSSDLAVQGRISEAPWIGFGVYEGVLDGTHTESELHTLVENQNLVEQAGEVHSCGDLDGDSIPELCAGNNAPPLGASPTASFVKVYVFRGPLPPGTIHLSDAEVQLVGFYEDVGGFALGGGRDLTGDGLPDLVVGADERDNKRGGVYLVADPPDGISDVVDHPLWAGEAPDDQVGLGSSVGGDLDGDGTEDLFIGAHMADGRRGRAYVVNHAGGGELSDAFLRLVGTEQYDWFGFDAAIGDLDGDGAADLAVGIPRDVYFGFDVPGRVAIWLGPLSGGQASEADADLVFRGSAEPDAFGMELAVADTDGDGDHELVVAAPHDPTMGQTAGAVYLFDPLAAP